MSPNEQATVLLQRLSHGDLAAADELLPLVYHELHGLARRLMSGERDNHTLQATALVNEAYLRLVDQAGTDWESRAHFLRTAARAMRNVLVDHARTRNADKRGGKRARVPLDDALAAYEARALDMLALDTALERLSEMDEQLAQLVELRFFAGLTIPETAKILGVSTPTVERGWRVARLWLRAEIEGRPRLDVGDEGAEGAAAAG
ncbi:MAG: sigma-70 family RNA polymerase sigma factor [Planctomycetes bacterium]|nr:sigma-70 family RNA polymerase sigma factor [Planctomycetota bacterium]